MTATGFFQSITITHIQPTKSLSHFPRHISITSFTVRGLISGKTEFRALSVGKSYLPSSALRPQKAIRPSKAFLEKTSVPSLPGSSVTSPFCSFSGGSYETSNLQPIKCGQFLSTSELNKWCVGNGTRNPKSLNDIPKRYLTSSLLCLLEEPFPSRLVSVTIHQLIPFG